MESNRPDKLSLVFDRPLRQNLPFGQFVYPFNFPGTRDYFYHISHPLDTLINSISIRRTKRHANMVDYPIGPEKFFPTNILYEIVRTALDYQELELRAKTESARYILVKMQRGWTGSWNIHHEDEVPSYHRENKWPLCVDGKVKAINIA